MALLNPLGLLDNDPLTPVRVDGLPSGLACNCYCAKCGARFEAVHPSSPSRRSYFRHHKSEDCGGSFESAVHLMAKQVLLQNKCLMLPYLKVRPSRSLWQIGSFVTQEEMVVERQLVTFDRVEDEVWIDGRIPDIVMWKNDRKLLVEVFVTHDISEEKLQWLRQQDVATVRINLSWAAYDIDTALLARCFRAGRAVNVTPRFNIVSWVHHPREAAAQARVNEAYLTSLSETHRHPSAPDVPQQVRKRESQRTLFH